MRLARACKATLTLAAAIALPLCQARAQNAEHAAAEQARQSTAHYIRVVEDEPNNRIRLELAARSFEPADGKGPTVWLAGAVHIADKSFYESLQNFLDQKDVVLFEGVMPPGAGNLDKGAPAEGDDARAKATERRIRFLATVVERQKVQKGEYPATLQGAAGALEQRLSKIIASSLQDAWGHPFVYTVKHPGPADPAAPDDTFDITSLGADGKPGGDGPDHDISFSQQPPLKPSDVEQAEGIQTQMAKALGLVFQLDAMDHNRPNWRNSDMSVDQVQDRLDKAGADTGELFKMLDGSSFSAKLAGFLLRIIGLFPSISEMGKMVMVDVLANADDLLSAMPGGLGAMMDVIIKDRNQVVMDDLAGAIKEPGVKSVAIIYGAGHLPDMERRLAERFGYRESGENWFTAIDVSLAKTGMSAPQARQVRQMLQKQIQVQIKAAKRAAEQK